MNVSPNELRKETVAVLGQINDQIRAVQETAAGRGIPAAKFRDENGNWPMVSLLLAKSQCLTTLTQLNEQGRKR